MELYRCYKCGIEKTAECFHKNKSKPFGLDNGCKTCKNEYAQEVNRKAITDKHYQDNKEELIIYSINANAQKYKSNPIYRLQTDLGGGIRRAVKKNFYGESSQIAKVLGCTPTQFISHMESQFAEGMTWKNHGEWQVDHIIPNSYGRLLEQ